MGTAESQSNQNSDKVINLPARELVNSQQAQTLLGIAASAISMAGSFIHADETNHDRADKFGGEMRVAAENTFIAAMDRIQDMLADKARWDGQFQKDIEEAFRSAHESQMQVLEAQREAAEEILQPHFKYKPGIARNADGVWVAFVGDPNDMQASIIGLGATPAEAIARFDAAFFGLEDPAVINWLKLREQFMEGDFPGPMPPFPKHEQYTETEQLDTNGNSTPAQHEGSGEDLGHNSSSPRQIEDSGSSQV